MPAGLDESPYYRPTGRPIQAGVLGHVTTLRLEYEERKAVMLTYLDLKRRESDWHGCQDGASDIRDIDAALEALRKLVEMTEGSNARS